MIWTISHRADASVLPLADAHYNRQKPGTPQFVPPGRCVVLKAIRRRKVRAFWITSWPFAQYVKHEWAGAWVCSAFRNTGAGLSSQLITEAVAATRAKWPEIPMVWAAHIGAHVGIITFVDAAKVRDKANFGRCYLEAGWERIGESKGGLLAFGQRPERMPVACHAIGSQSTLFGKTNGNSSAPCADVYNLEPSRATSEVHLSRRTDDPIPRRAQDRGQFAGNSSPGTGGRPEGDSANRIPGNRVGCGRLDVLATSSLEGGLSHV